MLCEPDDTVGMLADTGNVFVFFKYVLLTSFPAVPEVQVDFISEIRRFQVVSDKKYILLYAIAEGCFYS